MTNVEVIEFRTTTRYARSRWGYGIDRGETESRPFLAARRKISTDESVEGCTLGGDKVMVEQGVKLLLGENPLDRERIWHWMDQMITFGHRLTEQQAGLIDCASSSGWLATSAGSRSEASPRSSSWNPRVRVRRAASRQLAAGIVHL